MNNIIYHYCNVEAFKAIIQNRTLWLSSVYNLNDYKEIHWIKDKVLKKLELKTTKDSFNKYNTFKELYHKHLPNVYIASFSQGADLLSQWRAYANDGYGVAIGFNIDYFKQNRLIQVNKVLYDEKTQENMIENILEPISLYKNKTSIKDKNFIDICQQVIKKINTLSSISKNELFKEEQEVRLVHSPKIIQNREKMEIDFRNNISKMKFRSTCGNLISYFELNFQKNKEKQKPILEIVRGPKNKFIDEEIKIFMGINGFYDVRIKKSKSSYR